MDRLRKHLQTEQVMGRLQPTCEAERACGPHKQITSWSLNWCTLWRQGWQTTEVMPMQLHALAFGLFASSIAPFGGFFASGFKRAFKIKVGRGWGEIACIR